MSLLIDSGIDTCADLLGILPAEVRDRLDEDMLGESPSAAALRVLATIRDLRWISFVEPMRNPFEAWVSIDWAALLDWARSASTVVRVRAEIAASLHGWTDCRPNLREAARVLDEENLSIVLDALRIAREGLDP